MIIPQPETNTTGVLPVYTSPLELLRGRKILVRKPKEENPHENRKTVHPHE
jgi:hypothetical protein